MIYLKNIINGLIFIFFGFFLCCKHSYQKKITNEKDNTIENFFIHANKTIIQSEEVKIDSLIQKTNFNWGGECH